MKSIFLKLVIILCVLIGCYFNQARIDKYLEDYKMNRMVNNPDIPLSLSFVTFALGPFRSLVADALWWRAIQQQDRGEYFDAMQLTDWITKLQPTYSSVWAYHAWNMSYNIAYDFVEPEDRWQWIIRAIELLRDKGLKYNPDDIVIRQELARIYFDRIGGKIDPNAEFFKNQWAFLMMGYFDSGDRKEIERLHRAAKTIEELTTRPSVLEYSQAAAEQRGIDVFDFEAYPPQKGWLKLDLPQNLKGQAGSEIYNYYRRQRIERKLKLDIDRLLFIDTEYGPLDWRLHQAHTIYWAAEKNFENFTTSGINFARIVRQSMIDSFYEGRLFYNQKRNVITRTNNLQIMGRIHDYFEFFMEHQFDPTIDAFHKQFLEQAVAILYTFNHDDAAHEIFQHYKEDYLHGKEIDFELFVQENMVKTLANGNLSSGRSLVEAALFKSFEWMNIGEYEQSNGYLNLAKLIWKRHQKQFSERSPAKLLPPFPEILEAVKAQFIDTQGVDSEEFDQSLKTSRDQVAEKLYIGSFDDHKHDESENHSPIE